MVQIETRSLDEIIDYLNTIDYGYKVRMENVNNIILDDDDDDIIIDLMPMLIGSMVQFLNREVYIEQGYMDRINEFFNRDLSYQKQHVEEYLIRHAFLTPDKYAIENRDIQNYTFGVYMFKPPYLAGVHRYSLSYI